MHSTVDRQRGDRTCRHRNEAHVHSGKTITQRSRSSFHNYSAHTHTQSLRQSRHCQRLNTTEASADRLQENLSPINITELVRDRILAITTTFTIETEKVSTSCGESLPSLYWYEKGRKLLNYTESPQRTKFQAEFLRQAVKNKHPFPSPSAISVMTTLD